MSKAPRISFLDFTPKFTEPVARELARYLRERDEVLTIEERRAAPEARALVDIARREVEGLSLWLIGNSDWFVTEK